MPDLATVAEICDRAAAYLRGRSVSPEQLDAWCAAMEANPRGWNAWNGPNWSADFLRSEICQRLWNTAGHPATVRAMGLHGLRFRDQRMALHCWSWWTPDNRRRYLDAAADRRTGGTAWESWLNDPESWRLYWLNCDQRKIVRQAEDLELVEKVNGPEEATVALVVMRLNE